MRISTNLSIKKVVKKIVFLERKKGMGNCKNYMLYLIILGLLLCTGCAKNKDSADKEKNLEVMEQEDSSHASEEESELAAYTKLYPDMYVESNISQIEEDGKKVAYLTFDDGPSEYTKEVLEILREKNVKATFFILGSTMTKDGEECLRMMVKDGHTIGLHTYSHKLREIYKSVDCYLDDMYKVYNQVYEITGNKPVIYRFPCGSVNCYINKMKKELINEMARRGFQYYDWNVTAEDSVGKPSEYSIKSNILKHFEQHNKPVILMHDSSINRLTIKVLPQIIDEIRESGYEFDTVDKRIPCHFRCK